MSYLSKKDRKRVSKLITKKLEAMGVKDEITFVASGKVRKFYKKDESGNLIMEEGKDGIKKAKLFEVQMPIAINVLRRTVRELRNKSPETIQAFLDMPTPTEAGNEK
jgi:hypothetical protein